MPRGRRSSEANCRLLCFPVTPAYAQRRLESGWPRQCVEFRGMILPPLPAAMSIIHRVVGVTTHGTVRQLLALEAQPTLEGGADAEHEFVSIRQTMLSYILRHDNY